MKYIILFLIGFNLYSKVIVGTIYDSYTKEAVPNVSIIMNYEKQEISTDSLGRFELIVDTVARQTISISFVIMIIVIFFTFRSYAIVVMVSNGFHTYETNNPKNN